MKRVKTKLIALVAAMLLVLACSAPSFSQRKETTSPRLKIKNFGQMDERFYRGARPKAEDYKALAALGINTVIDLTDNSMEYEKPAVEAAGLRYVNIPMIDKSYPTSDQVSAFLKTVAEPATGKFFVHCAGGRHRTGVMGAVYRFNHDQWNYDQVYAEMNQYEFSSGFGHGKQKDFVKDYWQQFQAQQAGTGSPTATIH
jgi:protein tyrosine/serine phosphatase